MGQARAARRRGVRRSGDNRLAVRDVLLAERARVTAQVESLTRDFDSSLPPSSQWQQGELVQGATDIAPGTPIATFNFNGAYGPPDSPGGESGVSHTGIYLGQDASGVQILDQWSGSGGASIHTIPWSSWGGNTAEAGSHYYTIM